MRIVFAGTPAFAATALSALLNRGDSVVLVLTQPDRPSGRGLRLQPSPVKTLALERGLQIMQPASLRSAAVQHPIAQQNADVWVVAAYGLILPTAILDQPRLGCINIHASLLPRWRGAAPIQRAILAGDRMTGISIMQMDAGLDTGPILLQRAIPISETESAGSLHDRLAVLGAELIGPAIDGLARGELHPMPQSTQGVTYAAKLAKLEAQIDWAQPATEIARLIRAMDPLPGAVTSLNGVAHKVWGPTVRCSSGDRPPGTVIAAGGQGITISCGKGTLTVAELQRQGGRRLAAAVFLRGSPIARDAQFGT